jgi:hypothetical protein
MKAGTSIRLGDQRVHESVPFPHTARLTLRYWNYLLMRIEKVSLIINFIFLVYLSQLVGYTVGRTAL